MPEKMRWVVEQEWFEKSKEVRGLRRHALERRDIDCEAFVRGLVSAEYWAYKQSLREQTGPPTNTIG